MVSLQASPLASPQPMASLQAPHIHRRPSQSIYAYPYTLPFDSVSAVNELTFCAASRDPKLGSCLHAKILKSGLDANVFVSNALLDMYLKNGFVQNARNMFDLMPERTVVTWTSMISGYSHNGSAREAILTFLQMLENHVCPNEFTLASLLQACLQRSDVGLVRVIHGFIMKSGLGFDHFLQNSLVGVYAKSGMVGDTLKLLDRFGSKNVVAWTSVISGSVLNGLVEEAVFLFFRMQQQGVEPNEITLLSLLHACSLLKEWSMFTWVHGLVLKLGLCDDDLVVNSLVEMYLVNRCLNEGISVFREFGFGGNRQYLTPETMATLLQGSGLKLGEQLHGYLTKHGVFPCTVVENSLIDMYGENGRSDSAIQVFSRMQNRDIVSWNSMAMCFAKNGRFYDTLRLVKEIHKDEEENLVSPDFVTMLASVQACSNLASLQLGGVLHGYMTRTGLYCDTFIQNALVDMYGRTGRLDLAEQVFEEIPVRNIGSYNSLIAAHGHNGNIAGALQIFAELKKSKSCKPNAITFTNILSACSHAGMVREGFEIFGLMQRDYEIEPSTEHFACMVDLLGRSGKLKEAEDFIQKMPVKPDKDVWGALLGACGFFGHVEIAEKAAKELLVSEPKSNIWRVALSNVYASAGRWDDVARLRAQIRRLEGMQKESGWSSVEIDGESFRFMVNDTRHPESQMIYAVISTMQEHTRNDVEYQVFAYN